MGFYVLIVHGNKGFCLEEWSLVAIEEIEDMEYVTHTNIRTQTYILNYTNKHTHT